jgi:hypothetical protein
MDLLPFVTQLFLLYFCQHALTNFSYFKAYLINLIQFYLPHHKRKVIMTTVYYIIYTGNIFLLLFRERSLRFNSFTVINTYLHTSNSRDSSVGIALGYELGNRGSRFRFRRRLGIFVLTTASRTALVTNQSLIQ